MSELKKPTIEGLVEKLVNGKFIESDESTSVEKLLRQATENMSETDISSVVTKLNDKLDATSSEILTSTGTLNYSVFESEVKKVTQVIIKNNENKTNEQAKVTESEEKTPIDEKKNEGKKEEQAEIEITIKNMKSIRNIFEQFPEFSEFEFSEEDLEELGKAKTKFDKAMDKVNELMKENPQLSQEEAVAIATQEYEIDIDSGEMQIAMGTSLAERVEEVAQEKNISQDEALEIIIESNDGGFGVFFKKDCEEAKKAGERLTFRGLLGKTLSAGAQKFFENKGQEKISEIEALEKDGWYLDVEALRDNIEKKERMERCFTWWRKKNVPKEELQIDYSKLAEKYLCTGQSVSQIYEQLKKEDPNLELKFNDILNGIIEHLESSKFFPDTNNSLESLRESEEEIRVYEQVQKSFEIAKRNSRGVIGGAKKEDNERVLEALEKKYNLNKKSIKEVKEFWIKRLKIDPDKYNEEDIADLKKHEQDDEQYDEQTVEGLENDRDRIIRDRNQIIKLSKEFGISTDEAAKKYFGDNPKKLKQYSISERKILLGKTAKKVEEPEMSFVLRKLGTLVKRMNNKIIGISEVDVKAISKKIESLQNDVSQPYELQDTIARLTKAQDRIRKCERINERLDRGPKKKNVNEVFEDKLKKEKEKEIFKNYLMSGKTATEILKELNKDGIKYSIDDVIKIIENGARRHLRKQELKLLKDSELTIYSKTVELELINKNKKNAEKKGLTDWENDYEQQIIEINKKLEIPLNRIAYCRTKMQRRMGILGPNETPEERREKTENQEEFSDERNSSQEVQSDSHTKGKLELGSIKTGGKIHNIKAIAQNGKVTQKGIKGMFAKIRSLYSDLKKSKQEEQNAIQEEKTTSTTFEGIR